MLIKSGDKVFNIDAAMRVAKNSAGIEFELLHNLRVTVSQAETDEIWNQIQSVLGRNPWMMFEQDEYLNLGLLSWANYDPRTGRKYNLRVRFVGGFRYEYFNPDAARFWKELQERT